jgi:ketosteroid isomerase-like protein
MSATRRSILATAGASFVSAASVSARASETPVSDKETIQNDVGALIQLSKDSNTALMRGDIVTYRALVTMTDDFTLMSPFGGTPTRGNDVTPDRLEAMGTFFRNGTFEQEVIQSYAAPDLVVLVLIERANVEVGGLPAQDWSLRVTLVYRREGSRWCLVHRHADPLAPGITLEQAAALARGKSVL